MNSLFYAIVFFCSIQTRTGDKTKCISQMSKCVLETAITRDETVQLCAIKFDEGKLK